MKSTANEQHLTIVEAPLNSNTETSAVPATPKHLSDPMQLPGMIEGWFAPGLGRKLRVVVGKIAVFRGREGSWGPHLKTGQVIVVENSKFVKITGRVERFLEEPRKTSRYYRGPVKPIRSSYVVLVTKIEVSDS